MSKWTIKALLARCNSWILTYARFVPREGQAQNLGDDLYP